jgi:hypothetical protein
MAALKENTGVLAEFRLNYNTNINALMIRAEQIKYEGKENIHPIFNCKVSDEVLEVICFRLLRTFFHRVRALPTKKGSEGPIQECRKYGTLYKTID